MAIRDFQEGELLREDSIETVISCRELFARKPDNWEVPELDDIFHYLINFFSQMKCFSNSKTKNSQGNEVVLEVEAGASESNGNIAT